MSQETKKFDRDTVATICRVTCRDFEVEKGRVVIDETVMELFSHIDTEQQLKIAIEDRLPYLSRQDTVIRVYSAPEINLGCVGITIEWRRKNIEEKIRDVLTESFTFDSFEDDILPTVGKIMELIRAEGD